MSDENIIDHALSKFNLLDDERKRSIKEKGLDILEKNRQAFETVNHTDSEDDKVEARKNVRPLPYELWGAFPGILLFQIHMFHPFMFCDQLDHFLSLIPQILNQVDSTCLFMVRIISPFLFHMIYLDKLSWTNFCDCAGHSDKVPDRKFEGNTSVLLTYTPYGWTADNWEPIIFYGIHRILSNVLRKSVSSPFLSSFVTTKLLSVT